MKAFLHEIGPQPEYKIEIPKPNYKPLEQVFKERSIPIDHCLINIYFGRHVTAKDAEKFIEYSRDADVIVPESIMWAKQKLSHYLYDVFSESDADFDSLVAEYGIDEIPESIDRSFFVGLLKGIKGTRKKIFFVDDEEYDPKDQEKIAQIYTVSRPEDIIDLDLVSATQVYWLKLKSFVEFQIARENRSIEKLATEVVQLLERHPELIKSELKISFFWGAAHERFAQILKNAGEQVHVQKDSFITIGISTAIKRLSAGEVLHEEDLQSFMLESIFFQILMRISSEYRKQFMEGTEVVDATSLMHRCIQGKTKEEAYRDLCKAYNDSEYAESLLSPIL